MIKLIFVEVKLLGEQQLGFIPDKVSSLIRVEGSSAEVTAFVAKNERRCRVVVRTSA